MIKFLDIPQITASFQPELNDAIKRVVEKGWYIQGEECREFEAEWAEYCHKKHAVGVGNGLDALTLILLAYKQLRGWKDDNEVIVPALTYVASVQAIVRAGLKPVLADVNRDALLTAEAVEPLISSKTVALLPVHLYGQRAPMEELSALAQQHHLVTVEDAAQGHGLDIFGTAAFSFYPGKNLGALGDGGAVVTDDDELAERVRSLANYGSSVKYQHDVPDAVNSRLDELQAAVLRVKWRRLDEDNDERRKIAEVYMRHFDKENVLSTAVKDSVWHVFPYFCDNRDELRGKLTDVQTLCHYPTPIHHQKCFGTLFLGQKFPMAERLCASELSLPISPVMTTEEAEYVAEKILKP